MLKIFIFSILVVLAQCQDHNDEKSTSTLAPTTTEACVDAPDSNCADLKAYCTNDKFIPMLKQFCPVTCNMCPGATTVAVSSTTLNPNCQDMSTNCKNWVHNGFCTNSFYTCENRVMYCAKSCGLCYANPCKKTATLDGFMKIFNDKKVDN